ncbi:MAG: NitT/TauT family transport system ATP-binding protein [Clostridia bacterium]|nr:NitT/TauT family transport system ATP-binding protein [Clostridia bacterium]
MVQVEGVSYSYRNGLKVVKALVDIDFKLKKGDTCAIIGPSGCGKTTLLYLMAGLLKPEKGRVLIEGKVLSGPRDGTAVILQDYGLLPWKTVLANAALGLEIRGVAWRQREEIVRPLLAKLGLQGMEDRYPSQLSGGQKQRVAIARALALRQDLLLMDEPFSALDALTREELQDTLVKIQAEQQLTIIMVTHNIEEAVYLGKQIVVMGGMPGRVRAILPNPGAGRLGYRSRQEFHHYCSRVRGALGQIDYEAG